MGLIGLKKMEAETASIVMGVASILVVALAWRILDWVWVKPRKLEKVLKEEGFKGNAYRIYYGDSRDRDRMIAEANSQPMTSFSHHHLQRVQPYVHHTLSNYGERCIIWNGPVPMVVIPEPELIREILMKMNEFQKPTTNPVVSRIASGLVVVEGEKWVRRRKLITPAFHMDKLKLMIPSFSACCYEMIAKWEEMVYEKNSCEIEVWSYLHRLSADVISRAAFGSNYGEGRRIFELITEQFFVAIPLINAVYIPGWRFVPTKVNRRIMQIDREIRTLLNEMIQRRRETLLNGEKHKDDLLGTLLQSNLQDSNREFVKNTDKFNRLTIEEVIDESKIFYFAGQETTSVLLVWTLILLGKHQDWQERAREEVLAMFGKSNPDFHGLNRLKTMNMILHEVLRLYPPASEIVRKVQEPVKVGDILFPAGILVNLPILITHQDEKLWGVDAKEFNPDRFVDGLSKATGGNMSFFSFGWGPRICIGSNFAMIEAKMTLALILQRFSFELSPSYAHAPVAVGPLRPQFGAPIIFHRL